MQGGTQPRLEDFAGSWCITRRIDDHRAGSVLHFEGDAQFTPSGGGLDYAETGMLRGLGTAPIQATRRYRWEPRGAAIAVFFEDGRQFHEFSPAERPIAAHWCDPDSYRVRYDFSAWPVWSCRWSVDGPRKNYTMQSRYHRG